MRKSFHLLPLICLLAALAASAVPAAAQSLLKTAGFTTLEQALAEGWERYSQRPEISPEFTVSPVPETGQPLGLALYGASNANVRGCWRRRVEGITPGAFYRFRARYHQQGVDHPRLKVFARLDWQDRAGNEAGKKVYPSEGDLAAGWREVGGIFRAPQGACAVQVELYLAGAPQGRAWWREVSLEQVPSPAPRKVKLAAANCRPQQMKSSAEAVEEFGKLVAEAGRQGCDIICLGEGVNMVGVGVDGHAATYPDIAEPVPGPTTRRLGELARKHKIYIVAALGEREGGALYNTGVLIDREGKLAGKYRKVYVPEGELDQGITAGDNYPVFDTDFGRIGIMICYDSWYADPARYLSLQGAEVIFLPIWGGNETLSRARAIENHVYLVSSAYDIKTSIFDLWGTPLGEAGPETRPGLVTAEVDLNYPPECPYYWPMNDMRLMLLHELRSDVRTPGLN